LKLEKGFFPLWKYVNVLKWIIFDQAEQLLNGVIIPLYFHQINPLLKCWNPLNCQKWKCKHLWKLTCAKQTKLG